MPHRLFSAAEKSCLERLHFEQNTSLPLAERMRPMRDYIESLLPAQKSPTKTAYIAMLLDRFDQLLSLSNNGKPFIYQKKNAASLHFDIWSVQSEMDSNSPDELVLGYTKTMMGFLLFNTDPKKIAMIGLGGGSLPKYCYRYLPEASIVVVEKDPEVIAVREHFCIPKDDARFQVLCADGADFVNDAANLFDVLIVDGFERTGQPAQLCSQFFYDDCHHALAPDGIMAVNLLHAESKNNIILDRIRHSFNDAVIAIDAQDSTNTIVFACKGAMLDLPDQVVAGRLRGLVCQHTVDLHPTARNILLQRRLNRIACLTSANSRTKPRAC
jgi:spermidine synthase